VALPSPLTTLRSTNPKLAAKARIGSYDITAFPLQHDSAYNHKRIEGSHRMSGTTDKIKGRVKEAVGALTNDKDLKNEGKVDQASGALKDGIEKVIDKVKGVAK